MPRTLAFNLYDTLINTAGTACELTRMASDLRHLFRFARMRRNTILPFDLWGALPSQISASLTELEYAAGLHQ